LEEKEEKEKAGLLDVKGIGPKTAEKLFEHGIGSIEQLVLLRPEELSAILGINLLRAKEILMDAKDKALSRAIEVWTGARLKEYREKHVQRIPTGIAALDRDMGGGLPTDSVVSLSGASATGKSQMIYTLAVNCVGVLGRPAFIIETEPGTLSIERIEEIAKSRGVTLRLDQDLLTIPAKFVTSPYTQYLAYEMARRMCEERGIKPGLIAVDSFNARFRGWYGGRETLPIRSQEIARHVSYLQELASAFNTAVVISEQVYGVPDIGAQARAVMKFGDSRVPYGGEYMLHAPSICLMLNQVSSSEYEVYTFDVPWMEKKGYRFKITERGIEGAE
jgi:DNA repair protein RadA